MKVTSRNNYVSLSITQNGRNEALEKGKRRGGQQKKEGSVYAGDLNMQEDKITMQKRKLLKDALKVMVNQYRADREIDSYMGKREQNMAGCQARMDKAQGAIQELEKEKAALCEKYGVTQDSQEYKDCELILKGEKEGGEEMLTGYQREVLAYTTLQDTWREEYEKANDERVFDSQIVHSIKQSLLGRKYDMTDAAKASAELKKQAGRETAKMIYNEGRENIDKESEKLKEAEKTKEEKKAREEQQEETDIAEEEQRQGVEKAEEEQQETAKKMRKYIQAVEEFKKKNSEVSKAVDLAMMDNVCIPGEQGQQALLEEDMTGLEMDLLI